KINKVLTYDTLENRYVKWMMERLIHKLADVYQSIVQSEQWGKKPDDDVLEKMKRMKVELERSLKRTFWRNISKLDQSAMSLVMQMAPGYRDAFQIYLIVSKGLMLQGNMYRMSVKDIATLYEYWTFLKLGQILAKKYTMISQDIIRVNK